MKTVNIFDKSANGFKIEVQADDHFMIVDQPKPMGGSDEGATPMDYLLTALGSCIITVGLIVAKQERLPVKGIKVALSGDYDTDVLIGKNTEQRSGFVSIKVEADVEAPSMTQEEKATVLAKVEDRCPVTDNLRNNTPVTFTVK